MTLYVVRSDQPAVSYEWGVGYYLVGDYLVGVSSESDGLVVFNAGRASAPTPGVDPATAPRIWTGPNEGPIVGVTLASGPQLGVWTHDALYALELGEGGSGLTVTGSQTFTYPPVPIGRAVESGGRPDWEYFASISDLHHLMSALSGEQLLTGDFNTHYATPVYGGLVMTERAGE